MNEYRRDYGKRRKAKKRIVCLKNIRSNASEFGGIGSFIIPSVNTIRVYILCQMTFESMTRRFVWSLPKKIAGHDGFFN